MRTYRILRAVRRGSELHSNSEHYRYLENLIKVNRKKESYEIK